MDQTPEQTAETRFDILTAPDLALMPGSELGTQTEDSPLAVLGDTELDDEWANE